MLNKTKKNIQIKEAIIRTIAFFDMFNFPLTSFEIWKYLSIEISIEKIEETLEGEEFKKIINNKNGFYYLKNKEKLIRIRQKQYNSQEKVYKIALKAAKILRFINGIKLVAICNNFYYQEKSDIDLFIVIQKNRIWLTRVLATVIIQLFNLRRHGSKIADRICLSFYVTEDNLNLESIALKPDPYFYYWLAFLVPLYDDNCYEKFWEENNWLFSKLPNLFNNKPSLRRQVKNSLVSRFIKKINNLWFNFALGDVFEKFTKQVQLKKMSKNLSSVATADDTRVVITDKMLKFHEQDRREEYRGKLDDKIKNILNKNFENDKENEIQIKAKNIKINFLEKIIKYGLYLLVFLLPLQTRWIIKSGEVNGGYFEYGTLSLYGVDILLLLIIAVNIFLVLKSIRTCKLKIKNYWYIICALDLVIFLSIFWSIDKSVAIYKYSLFLLGVGLFWLIVQSKYKKQKFLYAFLAGASLQAMLGIWQFFMQDSFACKWLGIASHQAGVGGSSVIEVINGGRWLRAYGGLDHPNILGGLLAISLLVVCYFLIEKKKQHILKIYLLLNYIIIPILAIGLFVTFSRTAWLGFAAGIIVLLFTAVIKKDLLTQKKILRVIMISGIIFYILFLFNEDLVSTRFSGVARLEAKSSTERIESIYEARKVIKDNLFLGVGIGNYTQYLYTQNSNFASWEYSPVHNVFLLVLAEIGIIGFIIFLVLLFIEIKYIIKNNVYKLSLLVALIVMFMLDHWWWSLHFGVLFLFFVLSIVNNNYKYIKS